MKFEWDSKKSEFNKRKHGVDFEEDSTALHPLSVTGNDPDHSINEERFITFGILSQKRLLVVSHTERDNAIRIISARIANPAEREIYENA